MRTHHCGHIVADKNISPFAHVRNICCRHKFCVQGTKNVSDFVQKHFVSATNVSQFAQPKKHHEQQCVHVCQYLYKELIYVRTPFMLNKVVVFLTKTFTQKLFSQSQFFFNSYYCVA